MIRLLFVLLFVSCSQQTDFHCEYLDRVCGEPNEDGQMICENVFECKEY